MYTTHWHQLHLCTSDTNAQVPSVFLNLFLKQMFTTHWHQLHLCTSDTNALAPTVFLNPFLPQMYTTHWHPLHLCTSDTNVLTPSVFPFLFYAILYHSLKSFLVFFLYSLSECWAGSPRMTPRSIKGAVPQQYQIMINLNNTLWY